MGRTDNNFKKVVFEIDKKTYHKLQSIYLTAELFPDEEFVQIFKDCKPFPQDQFFFYEFRSKTPLKMPSAN